MPVKLQGRAIDSNTSISINTFSIGSNINANTTTVFVGNSTVNTNISAATILINGVNVNTAITSNAATAYTNATSFASNADNISSGTLNTARLPATVNVATILNVGANAYVNTSAHFVGNATVNSILTSTTLSVGGNTATFGTAAYVVANGFVGIGTGSPSRALTIEKSGAAFPSASNPTIRLNETSSGRFAVMELDSSQNLTIWNGDAGSGSIRFYRGSGSGTLSMSIDGSGNLGVGLSSPGNAKLRVEQPSGSYDNTYPIQVWAYANKQVININNDGSVNPVFNTDPESYWGPTATMIWKYRNTEQMRLASNGNVGIANTAPTYALHVTGSMRLNKEAGVHVMSKTIAATANSDIFTVSNQHGAQAFRVSIVNSSSGFSVAKIYEVVHQYGATPVYTKVVDTGAYSGLDFTVTFSDSASTGVKCNIKNDASSTSANFVTTLWLSGSATTITLTEH